MKIETIKKDNKKKWIIGSIIVIALIATVTFIATRANYKNYGNTLIARGTIKYKGFDLELISINIQNETGGYSSVDAVPTSGYTLNTEKSVCKVGEEKQDVTITYENGKINISGLSKKGNKCEVYFDNKLCPDSTTTCELILSKNTVDKSRTTGPFNKPYKEDTAGKIFSAEDDDGTTYFFAGSNPNNWVKFATNKEGQELYWRIIRINGNGSIRLIYNGPTTDLTGATTQIGTSKFSHKDAYWNSDTDNAYTNDNAYVGYMYGTAGSSTYEETHANINSSEIKNVLDTWYEENLKTDYSSYLDSNVGFCGDRSIHDGAGIGVVETHYKVFNRIRDTYIPMYKCPSQSNDLYTISSSTKGNKALINPIGLITMDEAFYAGGRTTSNYSYWLYTGQSYWTMSPYHFGLGADGLIVKSDGTIDYYLVSVTNGVRPVINLKADALTTGSGTTSDPYRIA